jgi:ADP-ribosylglycohydrolase
MGAIAGDIIGSVFEAQPIKTKSFPLFFPTSCYTDDTVLTVAVADCILSGKDYVSAFHQYVRAYPGAGFGGSFLRWALRGETEPYGSFGNGSAMRVSPIGFAFDSLEEVLEHAEKSARVTHDHPEGIRGAQATATAIWLARGAEEKSRVRAGIEERFGYDLGRRLEEIRPHYAFDVSCQGSVPESIIAFLESEDWEEAVRGAISLGGDADTMACIAGAIAEAYYGGVPREIREEAMARLDESLSGVTQEFCRCFALP